MFTGIVEELGTVKGLTKKKNLYTLSLSAKRVVKGVKLGDSIAVNGVCLTVTSFSKTVLKFDMMRETLEASTLSRLKAKQKVNLERALKMSSRLGGHFVTGHADGIGEVIDVIHRENWTEVVVRIDKALRKFVAKKGSITVDGVSLTVGECKGNRFSVYLIPFTKDVTTFGQLKKGDQVNVEVDILARYVLNGGLKEK